MKLVFKGDLFLPKYGSAVHIKIVDDGDFRISIISGSPLSLRYG